MGEQICRFTVWAPQSRRVVVRIKGRDAREYPMQSHDKGYWSIEVEGLTAGALYTFAIDDQPERPDPASRSQPQGVHGPSQVVDLRFKWADSGYRAPDLEDFVIYELHVGTFSDQGDFKGVIEKLEHLVSLGITAVEIMPIAQFPGSRNWGYDGVYPFAVQDTYGGPEGLQKLVEACHARGLAVILDVVYNHMGPEGNYLRDFGPYFTAKHKTDWGDALNFDDVGSEGLRNFFLKNARFWLETFHIDALRLDAVHAILDSGPKHFLEELSGQVENLAQQIDRPLYLIAESDENDISTITPRTKGGLGLDAQWSDDFHHCVHSLITGEDKGYFQDFGRMEQLAKAFNEPFVYSGQYSPYRKKRVGTASRDIPGKRFIVCTQNHDQVGNRMLGERLTSLVPFEALKLVAGAVLLSPYLPLLFMGEEFGETAPFQYFVSHTDPQLVAAVRTGRRNEFASFSWEGEVPDPQGEATFSRCRLDWNKTSQGEHLALLNFYRTVLKLRRDYPALSVRPHRENRVRFSETEKWLTWERTHEGESWKGMLNFSAETVSLSREQLFGTGDPYAWNRVLDSGSQVFAGVNELPDAWPKAASLPFPPYRFALYRRKNS